MRGGVHGCREASHLQVWLSLGVRVVLGGLVQTLGDHKLLQGHLGGPGISGKGGQQAVDTVHHLARATAV